MALALVLCVGVPLAAVALMATFSPRFGHADRHARASNLLFTAWLTATVVFSPYTAVLQVGGLPDLSIERGLLVCTLVAVMLRLYRHDVLEGQDKLLETLMFAFSMVCIISMARFGFIESYGAFNRPTFIFMSGYLMPFLAFAFTKYLLDSEDDLILLFKVLFWLGAYLTVTAYLERSPFKQFVWPGYIIDPEVSSLHLDRARGPFLNAAFNGVALNIAFLCGMLVYPTLRGARRWLYILVMAAMVGAIYLTRTRSVYVHFLLTVVGLMTVYQTKLSRWRVLPATALILIVVVGANFDKLTSEDREGGGIGQMKEVYIRLGLAEKSLDLLSEHPFGGIGLTQFRTTSLFTPGEVEYQHNQLIGMAVELGLPGAACYLAMLLVVFRRLCKLADRVPLGVLVNPNMALLLSMVLFVSLWNAVFVEPTMHLFISTSFFVFAGIVDQLYNRYVLRRI